MFRPAAPYAVLPLSLLSVHSLAANMRLPLRWGSVYKQNVHLQAHGWSLRGDDQNPEVAAAAKDAFVRAEKWFKANL